MIKSIKLSKEVEQELVSDLKKNGTAFLIGIGRFSITKYKKKSPVIPSRTGNKVRMVPSKVKHFSKVVFRPTLSFKELVS